MINLVGTYWKNRKDKKAYCKVTRQSEFNVWLTVLSDNGCIPRSGRFRTWCLFRYWTHMSKLEGMVKLGE